MDRYDEGYQISVENKIDKIRAKALCIVQKVHPEIEVVIDHRTIEDYSYKTWEYPGQWYYGFKLPRGYKNEDELAKAIAEETIEYFSKPPKKEMVV